MSAADFTAVGARALAIDPPAHPPARTAASPADGAPDLAGARAGGGVVGRIEPEILEGDAMAVVLAFPDVAIVAWALESDAGRAVLSERERAHIDTLRRRALDLRDKDAVRARRRRDGWQAIADATRNAARFTRESLRHGDAHVRRLRLAVDAARSEAGTIPDDGVDELLESVAAQRSIVLDGLRYSIMAIALGARELQLYSPRRAQSTFRPVPGTPTWCHTTGARGSRHRRHRWYRRLDDGCFLAEER